MNFNCTGCGACCRMVGLYQNPPESHPLHFPFLINDDLSCSMLDGNKCTVYENRPLICSVNRMAEYRGHTSPEQKKAYFSISEAACNILQKELGIDESFRIK